MKLVVSVLLCFFAAALADHTHQPFGEDVGPALKHWFEQKLEAYKKVGTEIGTPRNEIKEHTVLEDADENGDRVKIGLRIYNISAGDIKGKWDVTRISDTQLKINIELTQTGLWHDCKVVIYETKKLGPGEIRGNQQERLVELKWKENSGKVSMTVNLVDGKLSIDDLKTEVNVQEPDVELFGDKIKRGSRREMKIVLASEMKDALLSIYEDLVKEKNIRKRLHDALKDIESAKHGDEQQQSTK